MGLFLYGGKELWSFYQPPVQADMLSACMEYEDILSDKQRGAHPSPPKGREPDTHPSLPWRLLRRVLRIKNPDTRLRRITYPPEQFAPRRGSDMPAQGNALRERMQQG